MTAPRFGVALAHGSRFVRLLIVEDNIRISGLTARGLQPFGFSCDCAESLADADHAIKLSAYDALVLDLGMPDGDGAACSLVDAGPAFTPPSSC